MASCSADISREEGDLGSLRDLDRAVFQRALAVGFGRLEGDLGGERRLAHRRAPGEDDQIRAVQAAQLAVETVEAGGDAGDVAFALERRLRHVDGGVDRETQRLELSVLVAGGGQVEERLLGLFDLLLGAGVEVVGIGAVDHLLAQADQLAAQKEVVDQPAVLGRVDDGDCRAGKLGEVLDAADLGQGRILLEIVFQRGGAGQLASADQLAAGFEDAGVTVVGKMLGPQEVDDPVEGAVVRQDGAEELDLRLEIVRRAAQRQRIVVPLQRRDIIGASRFHYRKRPLVRSRRP